MENRKIFLILKTILFIFSFYLAFHFVGNKEYNCENNCSLTDAGGMLALFLLLCLGLFFYEKARSKILDLLKVYIPAFFVLYSSVYYIDSIQYEQEISISKNFIDFQIKYIELQGKNISNNEAFIDLHNNIDKVKIPFDKYVNVTLPKYKDTIGRAMMGLTIGIFTILILDILASLFIRNEEKSNKTLDDE